LKGVAIGGAACLFGESPAKALAGPVKLPRSSPEAVGVSPEGVLAFIDAVEQKVGGLHSFMLLRHGKVAAEGWWAPYAPQHPHMLYSLSKSFTSTAVGLAVSEGRLSVDARVSSIFPSDLPATISDNLATMRVRHLLSMSTGHDKDATGPTTQAKDGNWVKAFLALPIEHEPGTKFVYNSAATYMCSAIVQKLTGMTVLDYLTPRLFGPLGIETPTWEKCPRGINTGGWGLKVKTEDIARFGQMYLQKGKWGDRQLVPENWIAEATSKQISNGTDPKSDWAQGYGYQFWRCRNAAFRGDGAFGQYCVVMPEQDAVLAITSGLGDMQAVLNAAWDNLLPAMSASASGARTAELKKRETTLEVRPPEGKEESATAKRVAGKTYRFDANDQKIKSIAFRFDGGKCAATITDEKGERRLVAGSSDWVKGTAPRSAGLATEPTQEKVAARGAWADENTYATKVCFYETPYIETVEYKFDGDQVTVSSKMNVNFGPTQKAPIVGRSS
jgi:CubicO group peptidase (beta-lactamase class C family)